MASILIPAASAITLFLLFLSPSPANAGAVNDIDGEPLKNGGDYYILPYPNPNLLPTGGLTPAAPGVNNSNCPLYIMQQLYTLGSPVTIRSMAKILIIKTSLNVEFYFNNFPTSCNDPLRWFVAKEDSDGKSFVIVGAPSEKFKPEYNFRIKEAETGKNVYNIKFCHSMRSATFGNFIVVDEECKDVGLLNNDGRLGVTSNGATSFFFMKAAASKLAA